MRREQPGVESAAYVYQCRHMSMQMMLFQPKIKSVGRQRLKIDYESCHCTKSLSSTNLDSPIIIYRE